MELEKSVSEASTADDNNIDRLDMSSQDESQIIKEKKEMAIPPNLELPSCITDKPYIFYKNPSPVLSDSNKVGKWLMFIDTKKRSFVKDMTELDLAWQKAVELIKTTELPIIRIKCSTAYEGPPVHGGYSESVGVIMFYTPDFTNKPQVRAIAEEICLKLQKKSLIYKTDEASRLGLYTHHGKENICIYKFNNGEFNERELEEKGNSIDESSSSVFIPDIPTYSKGNTNKLNANCSDSNSSFNNFKRAVGRESSETLFEARVIRKPVSHQSASSDVNWRLKCRTDTEIHNIKYRTNSGRRWKSTRCMKCNWRDECTCIKSNAFMQKD